MKKYLILFLPLLIGSANIATAKGKTVRKTRVTQPVPLRGFRTQVYQLAQIATAPSGFQELKSTEVATGMWLCNRELAGFGTFVQLQPGNPNERLMVTAASVNAKALPNVNELVRFGLPGYTMQDSDNDAHLDFNTSEIARQVILTRKSVYATTVITISFAAHKFQSVSISIESWETNAAS